MRFRLDQAIQALQVGGFNQMVLTKTKVNVLVYFHNRLWYDMVCSSAIKTAAGGEQGGVGLVVRDRLK